MSRLLFVSFRENAGKTSLILALNKLFKKSCGYAKPFGDRLVYKKKELWDYDASLVSHHLGLKTDAKEMTIGFDHSKLRFMYDHDSTKAKLRELFEKNEEGKDLLMIEGGKDLTYGASVNLDALHIAEQKGCQLVIVASGNSDEIVDDLTFLTKNIDKKTIKGIIINKIHDIEDFDNTHAEYIKELGIDVLGTIPFKEQLSGLSLELIANSLFAQVISGESSLYQEIDHIYVGAMSVSESLKTRFYNQKNILIITSGDRSDVILTAMDYNASGIVLTNNILPPPYIISKASEQNIPMMVVPMDTYSVAKKIDNITPLLNERDDEKINFLAETVNKHVNWKKLLK